MSTRGLIRTIALALAFSAAATPAFAQLQKQRQDPRPPRFSEIALEEDNGQVLYERNAARIDYPASTTKLMTAFLFLEAYHRGDIKLDQDLPVSALAASQGKSNLGLMRKVRVKDVTTARNGRKIVSYHYEDQQTMTTIKAEDALHAMLCHSANDAAVVLAEALGGGSLDTFLQKMNDTAKRLGMDHTHYVNPNGMPDTRQVTTVDDMAKLARAVIEYFPDDSGLFRLKDVTVNGATYKNTNHLMLDTYPGLDFSKTGWTGMSGFNLVTSAQRDGKRVIAIVFGDNSSDQRSLDMRHLLDFAFQKVKNPKAQFAYGPDTGPMDGKVKAVRFITIPPRETPPPAPAPAAKQPAP